MSNLSERFPRSNKYHPQWVASAVSGGANALWLTEWLASSLDLRPGMKVLDLGCGRAASSIFLRQEFGVQVWAADLWFSPTENYQRIRDAGLADGVFPLRADARTLPFSAGYFDAIISIDSFMYYATDDHYLRNLARFVKPDGIMATAMAGLAQEIEGSEPPAQLRSWWEPALWSLHSAPWWKQQWERSGAVTVELAEAMPDGWKAWLEWLRAVSPENGVEINALESDAGRYLGYVRVIGRRKPEVLIEEPISSIPEQYNCQPLLKE